MPFSYEFPKTFDVTADIILIRTVLDVPLVLLIKRKNDPFKGSWAFPGGFVNPGESTKQAALRELQEETGVEGVELHQFRTYDEPGRDPRGLILSVVYAGYITEPFSVIAGDDAEEACWCPITELPSMAFDHAMILSQFIESWTSFMEARFSSAPRT